MMDLPRHWRTEKIRYALTGEVCTRCGKAIFPPRDVCPHCADAAQKEHALSGKGHVYSYATVYDAPAGYTDYQPYSVALVKLEEGPLVTAQLTDVDKEDIHIGMPVEMVTRKIREKGPNGLIVYGYKFRKPLQEQPA